MAANETAVNLELRARRAYEWGRLRWSLRLAPALALAAGVSVACGRPVGLCCALLAVLLPLAVGLSFAGGSAGRAVRPGLLAGGFALAMPLLVRTAGPFCIGDACMSLCLPACVVGGCVAGVLIALRAAREGHGARFALSGLLLAGLMGSLGCTLSGLAGVGGMLAGALVAGGPVLLVARRA
jgi:hypothetical protein